MEILLLEDFPSCQTLYTEILEYLGHKVHVAGTVDNALDILEETACDAFILDYILDYNLLEGETSGRLLEYIAETNCKKPILLHSSREEHGVSLTSLVKTYREKGIDLTFETKTSDCEPYLERFAAYAQKKIAE